MRPTKIARASSGDEHEHGHHRQLDHARAPVVRRPRRGRRGGAAAGHSTIRSTGPVTVTVTPTWKKPRIDGGSPVTVAVTVSVVAADGDRRGVEAADLVEVVVPGGLPGGGGALLDTGGVDGVLGGGGGDLAAVEPHAELHAEEHQQDDRGEHGGVGGDLAAVVARACVPGPGRGHRVRSRS